MKITIVIADAQQIAKLCAIDLAPIRAEAEKTYPVPKSWANLQPNGKPSAKASPGPKGGAAGAASGRGKSTPKDSASDAGTAASEPSRPINTRTTREVARTRCRLCNKTDGGKEGRILEDGRCERCTRKQIGSGIGGRRAQKIFDLERLEARTRPDSQVAGSTLAKRQRQARKDA